ncbi:protein retroactive precursor [Acyrthosiphon pisum]|uniref:ACYPI009796 protein n=1 Tax=Acyrthosiphon pisum TaxID=7029 RepID=C4WX31_ACYPI|nr:protein retroactive precursor [Acyrthosiphon pisum]BAH72451.1 ACYPI009796 [Acyrthosiphon pisum]|eukprot:NP_001156307.1 protein retroactive precursor [Acyrthosiphon pisum]
MSNKSIVVIILLVSILINFSDSVVKRCFSCRSRGDLGSCKDRFKYTNLTQVSLESGIGVEAVPCASGWCGKIIETRNSDAKEQEFDTATQRTCLQRGPSDGEERCDDTMWEYKKVFMCFCHGDLCNNAPPASKSYNFYLLTLILGIPIILTQLLIS